MEEQQRQAVAAEQAERSPEAIRIYEGIAEALRSGRAIDHETAWLIARAITPGSGPIHQLALTGEIGLEVDADLAIAAEVMPEWDTWIAALDGYCFRRMDKGPVAGWLRDETSHDLEANDDRSED